jgi:tetratricopeptide (TPR) repeat protein
MLDEERFCRLILMSFITNVKIKKNTFVLLLFFMVVAAVSAQNDALLEYRNGNFTAAFEICQSEITADPGNFESYIVACWALLRLGRYNEVLPYIERALTLNRYDIRLVEIQGEVNYFRGRNAAALQFFQEYINLAPEGQRIDVVYYYTGEIFIRLGRFKHADIALSTALHFEPRRALWWTRLAYAREMSGERALAESAYRTALRLDTNAADAQRGLERTRINN